MCSLNCISQALHKKMIPLYRKVKKKVGSTKSKESLMQNMSVFNKQLCTVILRKGRNTVHSISQSYLSNQRTISIQEHLVRVVFWGHTLWESLLLYINFRQNKNEILPTEIQLYVKSTTSESLRRERKNDSLQYNYLAVYNLLIHT